MIWFNQSTDWVRCIRITGAAGGVLVFHGVEMADITSDDWTLNMEDVLKTIYYKELRIWRGEATPDITSQSEIFLIIAQNLDNSQGVTFPETWPDERKWHYLHTARINGIGVQGSSNQTASVQMFFDNIPASRRC